jgi:hypothetical protein
MPELERWYAMLLHDAELPGAIVNRPNTALTQSLINHAHSRFKRLVWELTDKTLRNFLTNPRKLGGVVCKKYRNSQYNGWSFPPLAEARAAWEKMWGKQNWENPVEEWSKGGRIWKVVEKEKVVW